jgi:hypothetical protein
LFGIVSCESQIALAKVVGFTEHDPYMRGDTWMKTALVVVSVSLTLAIAVVALFLIMTQTRHQPVPAIPSASHLKIDKVTDAPRVSSLFP